MLIETAVLSVVLAASIPRCGAGEDVICLQSKKSQLILITGNEQSHKLYSATLETALAADLANIPEVSYVSIERADGNLLVWIAVDDPTREVRERVFEKQYSIIEGFPDIEFDFNIIASRNRKPSEFASTGKVIYSREA